MALFRQGEREHGRGRAQGRGGWMGAIASAGAAVLSVSGAIWADEPQPCPCVMRDMRQNVATTAEGCWAEWRMEIDLAQPELPAIWRGPYQQHGTVGYNQEGVRSLGCWANLVGPLCNVAMFTDSGPLQWSNAADGWQPGSLSDPLGSGADERLLCSIAGGATGKLNIGLIGSPSIGDFPPPAPTVGGSTVSLVSDAGAGEGTSWQRVTRPTIEQKVDLITGLPLVQFSDLELPLAGGSYRLIRSKSDTNGRVKASNQTLVDGWWDWVGKGWMINEQPLLLIDSAVPDIVGNNPRTTYLVLDAFHSIPFQLIESNGEYEAPARFRAKLKHDGTWDATSRRWAVSEQGVTLRPRRYTASLYDGSVVYSFAAIYEDVPGVPTKLPTSWGWSDGATEVRSLHERPLLGQQAVALGLASYGSPSDIDQNIAFWDPLAWAASAGSATQGYITPGLGVPHYGLCTRIETAQGHRVEYEYCAVTQRAIDNLGTTCVECLGDCAAKGQVRSISVFDPGQSGVPRWKLFYKYRLAVLAAKLPNTAARTLGDLDEVYWALDWRTDDSADCVCARACAVEEVACMLDRAEGQTRALCEAERAMFARMNARVVDSIFVYDMGALTAGQRTALEAEDWCSPVDSIHDVSAWYSQAQSEGVATFPTTAPMPANLDSGDGWAQDLNGVAAATGPWKHRVRYHYLPEYFEVPVDGPEMTLRLWSPSADAMLGKSTTWTRSEGGGTSTTVHAFSYETAEMLTELTMPVKSMWTQEALASAYQEARDVCSTLSMDGFLALVLWDVVKFDPPTMHCAGGSAPESAFNAVREIAQRWASVTWDRRTAGFGDVTYGLGPSNVAASHQTLPFGELFTKPGGTAYLRSFRGDGTTQGGPLVRPHLGVTHGQKAGWLHPTGLSVREPGADARYYRIFRLVVVPEALAPIFGDPVTGQSAGALLGYSQSAMYHAPYSWWGYAMRAAGTALGGDRNVGALVNPPDYREARWVVIVDEFDSQESLDSEKGYGDAGANSTLDPADVQNYLIKEGQKSRRVVELSASGVVLRERRWTFDLTGASDALQQAQGLGEEFIYETVGNYFNAVGQPGGWTPPASAAAIPVPASSAPAVDHEDFLANGGGFVGVDDPWETTRRELLLVEHRSVGWSARALADSVGAPSNPGAWGLDDGLTRFFEYTLRSYDSTPGEPPHWSGTDTGMVYLPTLAAEGIKRGRVHGVATSLHGLLPLAGGGAGRLYSKQYFRNPQPSMANGPTGWDEHETDVVFTTPRTARLGQQPGVGAALQPNMMVWHRLTDRLSDTTKALPEQRVLRSLQVGPGEVPGPGEALHYAVSGTWLDEEGRQTWSATGLTTSPLSPGSSTSDYERMALSRTLYDEQSRVQDVIVDVGLGAGSTGIARNVHFDSSGPTEISAASIGVHPDGWERRAPDGSGAMNYVTSYLYRGWGDSLSDVFYPNGRRWARRVITVKVKDWLAHELPGTPGVCSGAGMGDGADVMPVWNLDCFYGGDPTATWNALEAANEGDADYLKPEEWFAREYVFDQLEPVGSGGNWSTNAPGTVRDYRSAAPVGRPKVERRVLFATVAGAVNSGNYMLHPAVASEFPLDSMEFRTQPRFTLERGTKVTLDANGRPMKLDDVGSVNWETGTAVLGSAEVNQLVDLVRERSVDGTVTRTIQDLLGRATRTYVGTHDEGWSGGTYYESALTNNLVLASRMSYGDGVSDAFLPTHSWRYARAVTGTALGGDPWTEPGHSADTVGYATRTWYDWRMRPVRVDVFDVDGSGQAGVSAAARVETTVTYFDHMDRAHTVVRYGMLPGRAELVLPAQIDPVYRADGAGSYDATHDAAGTLVSIHELFVGGVAPLSVVRTLYGEGGGVREVRTYDMSAAGSTIEQAYTSTITHSAGGVSTYSQSPQAATRITRTDALGRATREASLVRAGTPGAPVHEMERVDSRYDADGLLSDSTRLERTSVQNLAGGHVLSDSGSGANAAGIRTVWWHDGQRRQIATAHLGTEAAHFGPTIGARYVYPMNDPTATTRPRLNVGGGSVTFHAGDNLSADTARIHVDHYDPLTSKLLLRREVNGSLTAHTYYPNGKIFQTIENFDPSAGATSDDIRRATEYAYDALGRVTRYTVSTGSAAAAPRQTTRVAYGADVLGETGTRGAAGAYGLSYQVVSRTSTQVGAMWLPDATTGQAAGNAHTEDMRFSYTIDGRLAERVDARGVAMQYFYDGLGRLIQSRVGHYAGNGSTTFVWGYPASMNPLGATPVDRVVAVDYVYDDRGHLSSVTARGPPSGSGGGLVPGAVVSENIFRYDLRGNLIKDVQSVGGAIAGPAAEATTPTTSYSWSYQATTGTQAAHDRLASIGYPAKATGTRGVQVHYGATGSIDDQLSRIAGISSSRATGSPTQPIVTQIASFAYAGLGRRSGITLGSTPGMALLSSRISASVRDATTPAVLSGLDRFGQVVDLHYRNHATTPVTLYRGEFGYDTAGNRTRQVVTQARVDTVSHSNVRSQFHVYDRLNRLRQSGVGAIVPGNGGGWQLDSSFPLRVESWTMDHLGNWTGGTSAAPLGHVSAGNLDNFEVNGFAPAGKYREHSAGTWQAWPVGSNADSASDTLALRHATNQQNEIGSVQSVSDGHPATSTIFAYDAAGNLIDDGVHRYQYDAWGRLVSVHARVAGSGAGAAAGYGVFLRGYSYDGLGRLVRAQSPYPSAEFADPEMPGGANRIERYYYDGIRRIQEVVVDPAASMASAMMMGGDAGAAAMQSQLASGVGSDEIETSATSGMLELELVEGADGGGEAGSQQNSQATGTIGESSIRVEREYVWGPGDPPSGGGGAWGSHVDELLAQFDRTHAVTFALTDVTGDVVAVCDGAGPTSAGTGGGSSGPTARVVGQWVYDAYGNVLSCDHLWPHAYNKVGHKGLIFDRLDVGVGVADFGASGSFAPGMFVGDPRCEFDVPQLVPLTGSAGVSTRGVYHNRNRSYLPGLGRFAQADPNASGQTLLDAPVFHGRGFAASVAGFDVGGRYGDGGSFYQYVRSGAWNRSDPLGLFFSPIDVAGTAVMGGLRILKGGLENMIGTYGWNIETDIDWAFDWTQADEWHSRTENLWVADSFQEGICNGINEWLNEDVMGLVDPIGITGIEFEVNTGGSRPRPPRSWERVARGVRAAGDRAHHMISMYKEGRKLARELGRQFNFRIDVQNPRYNLLALPPHIHGKGRHNGAYMIAVKKFLTDHMTRANKYGKEAELEFERAMMQLRSDILTNPGKYHLP